MAPFVDDGDVRILLGDCRDVLATLPAESVDCVATSPPFFGLRDYGTGVWEGGDDEGCDHIAPARGGTGEASAKQVSNGGSQRYQYAGTCGKCGARRVDRQIGLEADPESWAAELVAVFRECRRVLRPAGSMFVECGDSYAGSTTGGFRPGQGRADGIVDDRNIRNRNGSPAPPGTKPKDLLGQPFLLAFALRADGWYWRGCYPWAKPNAMPESAKDRCTTSHSYILHFSKQSKYHFDGDAIAEPAAWERWGDQTTPKYEGTATATGWMQPKTKAELGLARRAKSFRGSGVYTNHRSFDNSGSVEKATHGDGTPQYGKHPRSVWTIPTQGYPGAHFATWPEALAARIILAGCPIGGTVLDPFAGSGTTGLVARKHGRKAVLIELSEPYCKLAAERLQQLSLLAESAG